MNVYWETSALHWKTDQIIYTEFSWSLEWSQPDFTLFVIKENDKVYDF